MTASAIFACRLIHDAVAAVLAHNRLRDPGRTIVLLTGRWKWEPTLQVRPVDKYGNLSIDVDTDVLSLHTYVPYGEVPV